VSDSKVRVGRDPTVRTAAERYAVGLDESVALQRLWQGRARLVSNARLVCFLAFLTVVWLAFGTRSLDPAWIAVTAIGFVGLVIAHDRLLRREQRASRMRRFFEDGLARLEDRWIGRGDPGDRYREPGHPYADDLDVFGRGSLFELLATTRTAPGSDQLARWLKEPADPETIRQRQAAVIELVPRLDLRLEMALAGDESGSTLQQTALESWASAPAAALPRWVLPLALAATSLSLTGIGLWIFTGSGPIPALLALLVQGLIALALRARVTRVLAAAETPVQSLSRTASLLGCFESERFDSTRLAELRRELDTTGRPPSGELDALRRLVDRRDARRNQFFAPIAALLMWGTHVALALEGWRARCGPRLSVWVAAAGEIEAVPAEAERIHRAFADAMRRQPPPAY